MTIEALEERIKLYTFQYNKLNEDISSHMILSRKLEGAIEALQLLIKEEKDKISKEDK